MSLPSQSRRSGSRSTSVNYRQSRASTVRRLGPAVLVVGALAVILWFAMRPTSDTNDEIGSGDVAVIDGPLVIENSAAGNRLPGSGDRPDTRREVEETIETAPVITRPPVVNTASITPRTIPTTPPTTPPIRPTPPTTTANDPNTSSLLEATRNNTAPAVVDSLPVRTSRPMGADRVRLQLDTAQRMVDQNDRVAARQLLSSTLHTPGLSSRDAQRLRDELTAINDVLLFGPVVAPGDPMCEEYKVQSGDSLSRIAARRELATHWKLIQRVNQISNPSRIRLGQTIKLVQGPFHAVVHKRDHRLDLYHGSPSDRNSWVFIRSMSVGLGADNGTPIGTFTVSTNKLENPGWVNPRNASESYSPNDPANPIGEFWLGLDGVGEYGALTGYGLHGTIDPGSIGDDQSMGCVRLGDDDIAVVYELLVERVSVVEIRP